MIRVKIIIEVFKEVNRMSKREELLTNAAKIIYEEGIQKLTMDYLAQRSNITKGGVLYHFESKGNLLLQMNKMIIKNFEQTLKDYVAKLSGSAVFTRAYAYATLDFLKNPEEALLPSVYISSLEDKASFELWQKTSANWERKFREDCGDPDENLKLQLMCDGIWLSILYGADNSLDNQRETIVRNFCDALEKENR